MMNFSTLQGLTIPEGVVTQIAKDGVVLWSAGGGPIILEVEKITGNTYAGETAYTGEEFILLEIYPKTNGTVKVTYGGLTKTITDTSGAEEPNSQEVFFGTFNGVSDSTPSSGELTIDGDYRGVGCGLYQSGSKSTQRTRCSCVTAIKDLGSTQFIPNTGFSNCTKLTSVTVPSSVTAIGDSEITLDTNGTFYDCINLETVVLSEGLQSIFKHVFGGCTALSNITLPSSLAYIYDNPFLNTNKNNFVAVDSKNTDFKIDGNCLIDIDNKSVISGFLDSVIPSYVVGIKSNAFQGCAGLTNITIPDSVNWIKLRAFQGCAGLTSVTIPSGVTSMGAYIFDGCTALTNIIMLPTTPPTLNTSLASGGLNSACKITVPKGCGDAYKTAENWSDYESIIVEVS